MKKVIILGSGPK